MCALFDFFFVKMSFKIFTGLNLLLVLKSSYINKGVTFPHKKCFTVILRLILSYRYVHVVSWFKIRPKQLIISSLGTKWC